MKASPTPVVSPHAATLQRNASIRALANALGDGEAHTERVRRRLHRDNDMVSDALMNKCTELVARADSFRESAYITAVSDSTSAEVRRTMLAMMHQATFDTSWQAANAAVDSARSTDVSTLMRVIATDAASAAAFGVAMCAIGNGATTGVTATGGAMVKAAKAGTTVGKVKAALWGGATLGVGTVAVGAGLIAFSIYALSRESNQPERRAVFTTELGKDLLFIEIMTGHRYGLPPEPLRNRSTDVGQDMRHAYMGGHAR